MDKKEEYIKKLDAQLREWSAKIDELKAKADKTKGDLRIEYSRLFEAWDVRKEAAQKKLKEIKETSGVAWEEVKTGAEKALHELKISLDNAIDRFKHH